MMQFFQAIRFLLAIFPAPIQAMILGIFAFLIIRLVLRLVALVLDSIPFL